MKDCIDYFSCAQTKRKAVTLVMHGLNVKPGAMQPLIDWLNAKGSDVYLVRLAGHDRGDIKCVSDNLWQQETTAGYEAARNAALQHAVPLYFLGYSLGALLAQSCIGLQWDQPFQKQVLFSPAIGLRKRSYLIRHLFFFGYRWLLPSFTPRAYKANHWLPLRVYSVLYGEEKKLFEAQKMQLNFPTLVFMDPKDELINYKSLQTLLQQWNLTQWRLVPVDSSLAGRKERYHHLIIDKQSMGAANWQMVTTTMGIFLFDEK